MTKDQTQTKIQAQTQAIPSANSQLNAAVLFLVFNRPSVTAKVFEAIRQARPPKLYVGADGPRQGRLDDEKSCAKVRHIATQVDWPCEVRTLFRDSNLGSKQAVSAAINWFFDHEEQGIILEDDCLPHQDFFFFCQDLLYRYANNDKVWVITGDNFQDGHKRGDASYYFSRYNHVWGWATWRRAWSKADMHISFWPEWKASNSWRLIWPDTLARRYWEKVFDNLDRPDIDAWDYPWTACVWYHGGLTATPNVNLISNIGFGADATHTASDDSAFSNMPTHALGTLTHPHVVAQNVDADRYVFDHNFGGRVKRFPYALYHFPLRVIKKIFRMLLKVNLNLHRKDK